MLYGGDDTYDEDTTSGPVHATDRPCEACGASRGEPCAQGCPNIWDPR